MHARLKVALWMAMLFAAGMAGCGRATRPDDANESANSCVVGPSTGDAAASGQTLVTEAGFFDLPPQPTKATYAARMFYVFRPADQDAVHKPLVVFFNGGPGFATSLGLLAFGTGPTTLDVDAGSSSPVPNAASWTRFANLLYLDERMAGFSYGLGATSLPSCTMSEGEDAADFVRGLLAFLDGHVAIRAAPVVLAGESYGGKRATRMLDILLRYGTKASVGGPDLPGLVQAHYDAVFPESAGKLIDEATAARQFRAQVLVEPNVLGDLQAEEQRKMMPSDPYVGQAADRPRDIDPFDVRQPPAYDDMVLGLAVAAMSNATSAASLLGVSLPSIPRLGPSSRQGAFHAEWTIDPTLVTDVAQANAALSTMLGALGPGDSYLTLPGLQCPFVGYDPTLANLANVFAQNIALVKTFITHARYDAAIYTPAIPAALQAGGWAVTVDTTPRAGVARPGWFTVGLGNGSTVEVRFPSYDTSGHQVSVTQPTELADDVQAWLAGMCL